MKKLLSFLICTALILSIIPTAVFAAGETSGQCGYNNMWNYNTISATLTISGSREMFDFYNNVPWESYKSSIKYIVISDRVTRIGRNAFSGCTAITSITIPESVESIGEYACSYCDSLTSITIPKKVTSINESAFIGCDALGSIKVDSKNRNYYSSGNCLIEKSTNKLTLGCKNSTIPLGVTSIGNRAFCGCTGLTSITIPDSVTSIGNSAFSYCTSLTGITIPDSVIDIGEWAFSNCYNLVNVTIPNSVTNIGRNAFYDCTDLTSINIPNSVTSIKYNTFSDCSSLASVTISDSVKSIESAAFSNCSSLISIVIPRNVTSINGNVFCGHSGLSNLTVDSRNEKYYSSGNCIIEKDTNKLALGCKNSVIPDSVTTIDSGAFSDCTGLTSITIPDSVTSIGSYAFYRCTGLTSITIPDSVTSIGDDAFSECTGLTSITIPNSVTIIGRHAFYYCSSLENVYYFGSEDEWNKINSVKYAFPSKIKITYNATDCDINNGHSLGEWIEEVPETCTKDGIKEHYECIGCHKYFDKDKNEITDLAIPAHHTPVLLKKIPLTH